MPPPPADAVRRDLAPHRESRIATTIKGEIMPRNNSPKIIPNTALTVLEFMSGLPEIRQLPMGEYPEVRNTSKGY